MVHRGGRRCVGRGGCRAGRAAGMGRRLHCAWYRLNGNAGWAWLKDPLDWTGVLYHTSSVVVKENPGNRSVLLNLPGGSGRIVRDGSRTSATGRLCELCPIDGQESAAVASPS